ncbi:MAG: 3-hydroxybenzoate 6-hydroxylase 1 [Pseudomonadota bacterium]
MPRIDVPPQLLVVGAGIGGLALAHAWTQRPELAEHALQVVEQAAQLTEVGAGVQLGPNATRILKAWGLEEALKPFLTVPDGIEAMNARGQRVGWLPLGERCQHIHGAPYWTIHRGDLHRVLWESVRSHGRPEVHLSRTLESIRCETADPTVALRFAHHDEELQGTGLIAADGIWSTVRRGHWPKSVWRDTGQVAYRALVPMGQVPERWHSPRVRVWMLPRMHVVAYPIEAGRTLNLVVLMARRGEGMELGWDQRPSAISLEADFAHAQHRCPSELKALLACAPDWRVWPLVAGQALRGPQDMARGVVALLGDAAHPMLPYMAQGAGMAIEDAQVLTALAVKQAQSGTFNVSNLFAQYAQQRWARCARVQRKAIRNGQWFHAAGLKAWVRDVGLCAMSERVMDVPWLYQPMA